VKSIRSSICTPERACPRCPALPRPRFRARGPASQPVSASSSPRLQPFTLIHPCSIASALRQCDSLSSPPAHLLTSLYFSLPAAVLSSISTHLARGDHTTVLSEPASLPPIYTTRLLSFTLPFPRPPQIAFQGARLLWNPRQE
jgi:hypothetical protein